MKDRGTGTLEEEELSKPLPVQYSHVHTVIHQNVQEINILEIDPGDHRVKIRPILSYNKVFGFEYLSAMANRSQAYAAVNGAFFGQFGEPGGMVIIDGEMMTSSDGKFPVFIVDKGKAGLREIKPVLWLGNENVKLNVNSINEKGTSGQVVIYTPKYGSTNRAEQINITVVIEDDIVKEIAHREKETPIPSGGMVLTYYAPDMEEPSLPFKVGDRIALHIEHGLSATAQAYECGSWVVKDGAVVIGENDPWIGVTTNRDPRTAVGIKEDGKVVLMTVDGRQPGFSEGLTGQELGQYLLDCGVKNAAMLDGGASTEMIVQGRMVNRPSYKGQERMLAGGIVVLIEN